MSWTELSLLLAPGDAPGVGEQLLALGSAGLAEAFNRSVLRAGWEVGDLVEE